MESLPKGLILRSQNSALYLIFCKAYDTVLHSIFPERFRFDGWTFGWIMNWLECSIQKVVISGSTFRWELVTSTVPQEFILGPVQFNVFISDINCRFLCILSNLQMTPTGVVQLTCLRDGMSSRSPE